MQKPFETAASSTLGSAKLLRGPGMLEKQENVQRPHEWEAQAGRDRILGGFSARRHSKNKIHEVSLRCPRGVCLSRLLLHSEVCLCLSGSLGNLSSQPGSAASTDGHSQAFSRVIYLCLNVWEISSGDTSYELAGLADTNQELNAIFSQHIKSPSNVQHAETLFIISRGTRSWRSASCPL